MVTFVGSAKGTTTATMPAHQAGDIIVGFSTRNAVATAPGLPNGGGFISLATSTANTNGARAWWKIATSSSDTVGTSANATELVVHVYRPTAGNSGGIGAFSLSAGSSASASYAGLTLYDGTGNSWIAAFGQTKTQSVGISTAPTTFVNTNGQDELGTGELASFDTNGGVSSSATHTVTITSGVWKTFVIEILDVAPSASINNIVDFVSFAGNSVAAATSDAGNNFVYNKPNASLSGNTIVICVAYPSGSTPAITDNQSNTWPTSGTAGDTFTEDGGAGNMAMQVFRLKNAATGTQQFTIGFGSTTVNPCHVWILELANVVGVFNGTAGATNVNSSGVVSAGAFTPTNNNANGGNLILCFAGQTGTTGTTNPIAFVGAPGYSLSDADISWTQGQGWPKASQFFLQATSAATTPKFAIQNSGTDTYNILAVALSIGTQGTLPSTGIRVIGVRHFTDNSNPASWLLQAPRFGNLSYAVGFMSSVATPVVTAITSDIGSWTQINSTSGEPNPYYKAASTSNANGTMTVSLTGTAQSVQLVVYDITGADNSPLVNFAAVGTTSFNNLSSISSFPNYTPANQNALLLGFAQVGLGPTTGVSVPSGAIWDLPTFQQAQFTATIASTTMTVSATAWGTINANGEVVTGAGVTAGTTVQSGSGPYTIQPSQTISVGETMHTSMDDSNTMGFGNGAWHWYNGSTTSAQSITYNLANQPSNSGTCIVVEFKAAPSTTVVWGWEQQTGFQLPNPATRNLALNNRYAAAILRGDDGTEAPQINFVAHGWPVQPPQPPHPRPEKAGTLFGGDPGHWDIQRVFFQFGWPVQPWQPPSPGTGNLALQNRAAAIMRGDDGTQAQQIKFIDHGWPVQHPQPPHPRPERQGALARGDEGNEAPLIVFSFVGWETQPPPPPHPRPERGAGIFMEPFIETIFNLPITLPTNGWWIQDFQPPHPRSERAGAIMPSINLDAQFIIFYPYGWEVLPPPPPHFRRERSSAILPGTNIEVVLTMFFPMGWEVQPPPPPHPRPERAALIMRADEGIQARFIYWNNMGWEIQPPPPPHRFIERAAAIMPGSNIDSVEITAAPPPVLWENLPPIIIHPRPERAGAIMPGEPGIQARFVNWRNMGWEIQPPPPPHRFIERAGAIMRGDDGTYAKFFVWKNAGWEVQPPQPPHPRREKAGSIMLGDTGIEGKFIFVAPNVSWPFDTPLMLRYPVSQRGAAIYINEDGIEAPFIPPLPPPPPIIPRSMPPAIMVVNSITNQFDGSMLRQGEPFALIFNTQFLINGPVNLFFISPSGVIQQATSEFVLVGTNELHFGQFLLFSDQYVVYPTLAGELNEQGFWGVYLQTGVFTTRISYFEIGPP